MNNSEPRLEKIINQLLKYSFGDFSVRENISPKGDEIDAIIVGLNTLGEEIQSSGKLIRDYHKRVDALMSVLLKYTVFDFSEKAEVSPAGDELDAIAIGLNTLAEELVATHETEQQHLQNLSDSNHFLDAILENIPNMIFVKEATELKFVRFNKAGEELLGYSRDQMIGRNDYDFFPKEQADFFTAKDREALQQNTVTNIPEEKINTSAGEKWLHTKKIPILENGKPAYLLGISEDITAARAIEKSLKESNEQVETIISNAPNAVVVIDEESKIVRWNIKAENVFGWKADEVTGKLMYDVIMPPRYIQQHKKGVEHFLKTGDGPILNKILELSAIRKNKEEFPIELGVSATKSGGKFLFIAFINDITERTKTQAALRESEERFRLLVEGVKDYSIIMLDPTGHVVYWNKGAENIEGYKADEIIGKHFSVFYKPEDIKEGKPEQSLKLARENGSSEDEGLRVRKDGTLFWADVIFTPLYDKKNELRGYSKVTRDKTEKKEAEEKVKQLNVRLEDNVKRLEVANTDLESFTYSVSHDLRAPLRAIHGYTKILEEEYISKLDKEAITMMDSVTNNAKKMGRLIDDLLALSRLGRKELKKTEVDMTKLVNAAVEEVKKTFDKVNAEITVKPLPKAMADYNLIYQVFINLVSNSVKYSSKKEKPVIEIGSKEDNGEIIYYVKDNGIGFDMKYYDKLFGIFQRLVDPSEYEGQGVGLALVKRIITKHDGRVWAEAEPDKGATFYFSLKNPEKKESN